MYQVGIGHGRRNAWDLVQRERRNKGGGISCTKSAPATGEETRGTWCKGNGGTRAGGISCTKSAPGGGKETRETWCKGNGGIRAGGISCTKSASATGEETRGTWCKGNGGIRAAGFRAPSRRRPRAKKRGGLGAKGTEEQGPAVFRAPRRPPGHERRNARDLVQRKRRNKGRRDFVHQVAPPPRPLIRKFINFRMIIKVY